MEIAIPKLRERSNFPHWLRERRKRAEWALATVSAQRGPPVEGQKQTRQTPQPARAREHRSLPAPMA